MNKPIKPYAKLPLTEDDFGLVYVAVKRQIELMSLKATQAIDPHEKAFYERRTADYTDLDGRMVKLRDQADEADTSQDPEPEEDDDEEDPEG